MKDLRLSALAHHVVAWHNRHPLARRIGVQDVQGVGYVVMPLLGSVSEATAAGRPDDADAGTTLRERAMARAQQGTPAPAPAAAPAPAPAPTPAQGKAQGKALKRAFTEDFIAPLSPARVARWAARQGVPLATEPRDAPVRRVLTDRAADTARLTERWVLTAQIDTGHARTRVLVGAGANPAVLGRRLLSAPRLGVVAAVVLGVVLSLGPSLKGGSPAPLRTLASASAPTPAPAVETAAAGPLPAASATPAPAPPPDVEPTLGRVELPSLGPQIDARRRAAQEALQPAAAAASAPNPAPEPTLQPAPAQAQPPRPVAATGSAFAVSTRLLRTRTESEQLAGAMRALLAPPGSPPMHVDVLAVGDDWRVVGWPYADRAAAEKAQALLATRGMRVQIVDF